MSRKKILNKRGVFYSISVLLLMIFLIIVFNNKAQLLQKDEEFHVERVKIIIMDHFVRDFDNYYAGNIIETAAKPALINLTTIARSTRFSSNQLIELMANGSDSASGLKINPLLTTNENFQQSLATLSFELDNASFNYRLESAEQPSYDSIRLNFRVNYFFRAFDTNWSRTGKLISINVPVYGLWHPDFDEIIDSSWSQNSTSGCYINQIITPDPDTACSGMNMMPPS
jgi:hypothetical protein